MIFGKPWTQDEEDILLSYPGGNPLGIQQALKKAGFSRTIEAIQRKKLRLNAIIKPEESQANFFSSNEPLDNTSDVSWVSGKLPLNKSITKFVCLNDVHVPHNIDLTNIFTFIKEFKPDYIILNGDIVNNDPFSHWDKASPLRFKTMPQPKEYYEMCNKVFYKPLRDAAGKTCTIVHGIGNHEFWSNKAIAEMPEGKGYWEVENNIKYVDYWYASKDMVNLGKLFFLHGDIINGGRNHAEKMLNYFRRNVRYGHVHDIQERSYNNPIDITERHTARSCGTLQKFNPSFMGNRPHDWMHAFTYGYVREDGTFHDHTAVIVNNQFMANGKLYG
jgi:hypothetical protein